LIGSVLLHAAVFGILGTFDGDPPLFLDQEVELTILDEPPPVAAVEAPEPPEEVAPPEPEPPKPAPKAPRAPKEQPLQPPAEEPPPPSEEPPAAADETIADFSGTTLVGEGAGGWVSAVGSGAPMTGPIGRAGAKVTGRDRAGVAGGVPEGQGTRVVPLADLSREPEAPSRNLFNEALERNYPRLAKQQGIEGTAKVRLRVLPSGKILVLASLDETYPGFADACKKAVTEVSAKSPWTPPLDKSGLPVAIDVPFKCEFQVY
jgi:outer membrane biosynthesis protein TonB